MFDRVRKSKRRSLAPVKDEVIEIAKKKYHSIKEEFQFFGECVVHPVRTGAVTPSSRKLARKMASFVNPANPGFIVELGPGTGVVTEALINQGVPEERLVLIEMSDTFCRELRKRFPKATIVQGDAFDITQLVKTLALGELNSVVSSLPLILFAPEKRTQLINDSINLIANEGSFVQFSYHIKPPVEAHWGGFSLFGTKRIWFNLLPAKVWVYQDSNAA